MPVRRIGGVGAPASRTAISSGGSTLPQVIDAVTVALETLDLLQRRSHEVADRFRSNRIQEAHDGLSEIVQSTGTLLRLAMAAARATGANLTALCTANGSRVDQDTCSALDRLIAQQFAANWIALADALDSDFSPALAQWRFVFEALGSPDDDDDNGGRAA
jgi:hypothetical protein